MKTLALFSTGFGRGDRARIRHLEATDQYPRVSLFEDALHAEILDEGYLESVPGSRRLLYRRLPISIAQILEAYIVHGRYDAIVSWTEKLALPFAGLLKLTGRRMPHVSILLWISQRKKSELLKRVHSHIDRLIIPAPLQRDFAVKVLGIPPEKVVPLRWGVEHRFWRPMESATDMICAVGSEMRDYPTLIEAMRGLSIRCHIAAGTTRSIVSSWVKSIDAAGALPPNLTVGKKSFAELRALYARSRFLVVPLLPTDNDNGVTSLLEAMAMERAVICSRVNGQVGVVTEGETGLLVPPGDPRALREAIQYLWDHPEVAEGMGKAGRRFVERHHTFEGFVEGVKDVMDEVMEEHARRRPRRGDSRPDGGARPQAV